MNALMPRRDRLRRVMILCCRFAANLAYYRTGRRAEFRSLFKHATTPTANFWRAANSNFLDMCVLEWCKLFGDRKAKHYWGNIVTDSAGFQTELLRDLGLSKAAFQTEIDTMVRYRDKFLAHLDSDYTMNIPRLDVPKKSVWFYHAYVVAREAEARDLAGLCTDIDAGYEEAKQEARTVYQRGWL